MPKFLLRHQQKAILRLVPVPGYSAQISAQAPTKGYIETGARPRARCPNFCSGTNKRLRSHWCPCQGTVAKFLLRHQQKAMFRLLPVPEYSGQISAQAPTKGYVQTAARARVQWPNFCSGTNKRLYSDWCLCPGTGHQV